MQVKLEQKRHLNVPKYPNADYELAKRFAVEIHKELGLFLKAVVLFGSALRYEKPAVSEHDIDVLMVIDDLTMILTPEVVEAYRVITERVGANISKRFHITTMKLTSFWEYVRNGDPVIINMLREGVPLVDTGFFEPIQQLLFQGRIRPTKESIYTYYARAPNTLLSADWHVLQAVLDLYWAVIDAAHAALMHVGEVPPMPSKVAVLMEQRLVKPGLCSRKHAQTMDFFYNLSKKITHRQLQSVAGKDYDSYRRQADDFVKAMKVVLEKK